MGAGASATVLRFDESNLICLETVNKLPTFEVKRCLCKHPDFKDMVLIQYTRKNEVNLPQHIVGSVTLKAVVDKYFSHETMLERINSVRHLNHPSVVRAYSSFLDSKLSSLFLTVEPVLPCKTLLSSLRFDEFIGGLHSILQALDFLHTRAMLSHNSVEIESIFLDSKRNWKLCGFEFCIPLKDLDPNKIAVIESLKNKKSDEKATRYDSKSPHCYDIYCFSRMVLGILQEQEYDAATLSPVLEKSCLHESPKERLSASKLLLHSIFKSAYSTAFSFLSNYMLKSDSDKFSFFENFPSLAEDIAEDLFCNSIVPLLLSPSVFTDFPSQKTIGLLLTPFKNSEDRSPMGFVSESAFRSFLAPRITLLFRTHELNTRLLLLKHFPSYARLLGADALQGIILPEICLGLYDTCDTLVTASFTGLSQLAVILGPAPVLCHLSSLGDQLKSRGLLNVESPQSNHYTTTTISLGRGRTVRYTPTPRAWRRCANFPDSAPKVSAQARDAVNTAAAPPPRRLCDVAALSAKYTPRAPAPARVSFPPVTKTSHSHKESQRTFSTIFASLENTSSGTPVSPQEADLPEISNPTVTLPVAGSGDMESDTTSPGPESPIAQPSTAPYAVSNGEAVSSKGPSKSGTKSVHFDSTCQVPATRRPPPDAWNDWSEDEEEEEEEEEQMIEHNDEGISNYVAKISLNDSEAAATSAATNHQPDLPTLSNALQMRRKQEAQVDEILAELEPPVSFTKVPVKESPAPEVSEKPSVLRYQADPAASDWGNDWGDDEEL